MTADNPSKEGRDLQRVLEITRRMAATVDLDELLALIIERTMELLDAERASLFLYEADTNQLVSRIAVDVEEIRFSADTGIAGATIRTGQTINVPDAAADPRFNAEIDRETGFRTRTILSVPLTDYEARLVGVLQVLNKRTGPFEEYDIRLAETLGAQAGVSLQRARLIEHYVQKQEIERAMKIAREIQQRSLPSGPPRLAGYDLAGFNQPADDTGGDTYDFFDLRNGRWMLLVADASGHGIGPALVIAETRAMLRALARQGAEVGAVLRSANELLAADLDGRFVTCFLGVFDPAEGVLTYASAGHGPMVFYRRASDQFAQTVATGLPLGILDQTEYDDLITQPIEPGDFFVVTTDGFFEADSAGGEQFGIDRMLATLRRDRDLAAAEMIARLHQTVLDFTQGTPQADDLTAMVIKKL